MFSLWYLTHKIKLPLNIQRAPQTWSVFVSWGWTRWKLFHILECFKYWVNIRRLDLSNTSAWTLNCRKSKVMVSQNMPQGSCIVTMFRESQPEKKAVNESLLVGLGGADRIQVLWDRYFCLCVYAAQTTKGNSLVIKAVIRSSHNYIIRIHFLWRPVIPTPTLQIRKYRPKKHPRWTQTRSESVQSSRKQPGQCCYEFLCHLASSSTPF